MSDTVERPRITTRTKVAGGSAAAVAAAAVLFTLWPQQEGTELKAYQDSIGVWTICMGDTRNVRPGMVETPEGCMTRMKATIGGSIAAVERQLPGVDLTVGQYVSYADFIGNAGEGNFATSSMRRYALQGRLKESCDSFRKWVYAGGRDCRKPESNCRGIVTRREIERSYCLGLIGP